VTDVGKISLGVEIDASDLSSRLGEAVRRAIAPALAQINEELNKVQRGYEDTAKSAERSATRQVNALKRVQRQAEQTAAAVRTAQQAGGGPNSNNPAGGGGNGGGASNDNRRYDNRDNRKYDQRTVDNRRIDNSRDNSRDQRRYDNRRYNTSNKYDNRTINNTTYDHRVYNYYGPGGPGPNGPGPGGGNGNNRGGGGGGRGVLGMLTSPLGLNGIALGAAALPAVATGVVNIVGAVQQLGQAGLALPGIFAAGAASIGTAVVGFKGMGDAVKALNEAAKSGDMTKANEALKDMDPAAQAVAKTVSGLVQGPLKELKKTVQGKMFDGFDKDLQSAADKTLPRLTAGMAKTGEAWNGTLKGITGALSSDSSLGFMDRIFGNTAEGQKRANAAIGPLIHGMGQLATTGSDFLPRLGDGIAKVANRFDAFITKNAANGNLFRWIDEGLNGLRSFGNAILNVGKFITGLTKAAGQAKGSLSGDGGFLGGLERFTGKWADFVNSPAGQKRLGDFFQGGTGDLARIGDTLKAIWPAIREIIEGFQTWGRIIAPIVGAIANLVGALGNVPGLLEAIVVGFLAWRTIGGIIGGITTKLGGATGAIGKFGKAQAGIAGLGIAAAGTVMQQNAGDNVGSQIGGAAMTIGGSALTGAMLGSVIPGVGTAIGAAGGAVVGTGLAAYNALLNENKTANDKAAAAEAARASALERSAAAMDISKAGMKSATDALAESGGVVDPTVLAGVGQQVNAIPEKLAGAYDENTLKGIQTALAGVNMTTEQMSATITAGGPQFDALTARLNLMGPAGQIAAAQLASIRDNTLGAAQNASVAAPLLQQLADNYGGVASAQVAVQNAFAAIPQDVPINVSMPGHEAVEEILRNIGAQVDHNKDGSIITKVPLAPDTIAQLEAIGVKVQQNKDGTIQVSVPEGQYIDTLNKLNVLGDAYKRLFAGTPALPNVPAPPSNPNTQAADPFQLPKPPGGADGKIIGRMGGGVLPGYSPRVDNILYPMAGGGVQPLSGGEGILIPEAVRALGGAPGIYAINSQFRSGLSRRGYGMAGGGVFGADDGAVIGEAGTGLGPLPGPVAPGPDTELSVLISIRDLLAGKGGTAGNPLAATAANTATTATAATNTTGTGGGAMGPFGTPLKSRGNIGYKMAAAAISALGGDPAEFIGTDPSAAAATATATMPGMPGATTTATTVDVAALQRFAASGNTADLPPGLTINSPAVTAILAARNKKKGGLDDAALSDLVGQALGPGGFTGTLDPTNTPIVKALEKLRTKGVPGTPAAGGFAPTAAATGVPMTALPAGASGMMDPVSAFAQRATGGRYDWGASDLSAGLSDCSGAVSDLVELITKGQASPERLFSTADAASVLKSLGAVEGAVPGALQIGWSDTHMRSTLPNGVNFESGGQTGQGATYGGNAQGAAGMPNIMSLAVPGGLPMVPGMAGTSASGLPGSSGGQGTAVYVTNWPGGGGGLAGMIGKQALGAGVDAAGQAGIGVVGDIGAAITDSMLTPDGKRMPNASLTDLVSQRNPLALAAAAGLNVEDFTRQGGAGGPVEQNAQAYDASGRMFSDTGALMDRTMTNLNAQLQAMREQLVDVITQVADKLNDSALEPVIKAGMTAALDNLKSSISSAIGGSLGEAAAPPIAEAVSSAVANLPIDQSGAGGVGGNAAGVVTGVIGMAGGGGVFGGKAGKDSVPAMLMPGEFVFNTTDVARLGGVGGAEAFRQALGRTGGVRKFAQGGGVDVNSTVGAEFFGLSEVPIISTIVNMLVKVLLQVLGVTIEGRDTFNELTDEFRQFRGDSFKAFDAQGRLLNDTSALIDRSSSSEEVAAQERIRILKIVIQALVKYIIEKVIVPIAKAVANSVIQAGASAAGAATNAGAPGAGGIVSSLISSAGSAGVDIAAEVGTDFALAISEQLIATVAEGLQGVFPDLMTGLFSGAGAANLFGPLGTILTTVLGGFLGGFTGLLGGGVLGGASTLIPGIPFDQGGMASGVGYLPKATMDDELVLSPGETDLFSRFVGALERGGFGGGGNRTEVHAPITIVGGGRETADQVENRLLALMP
jgi:hypothetical protein